jgi:hypothetical protein
MNRQGMVKAVAGWSDLMHANIPYHAFIWQKIAKPSLTSRICAWFQLGTVLLSRYKPFHQLYSDGMVT